MATKKTIDKDNEKKYVEQEPSQDINAILEMVKSMQEKINSLEEEKNQLKENLEDMVKSNTSENLEDVSDCIMTTSDYIEDVPKKVIVYHMQELFGGAGTVIKLTNAKRRPTRMGQAMSFNIDDFEELVDLYRRYFDKGILALDAAYLDYAEKYDLPIYDNKTKTQYNAKVLKSVTSFTYEQLQNFYNNLSHNNKVAFLTYWLGRVYEKEKGYYDMEKMRWLNTISNTQTFSAILTELENAERRKVNLKLDADKMA